MKRLTDWLDGNGKVKGRVGPFIVLFSALLLVPVYAQEKSETGRSASAGEVTGDEVRLRGGPGTKFKPIGTVNQGTKLEIRGQEGEWTEVVPPEQATVWIYGKFIDKTNGNKGIVSASSVNIRPLPRVDQTNVPLGQVSSPKSVTIVDQKKRSDEDFPWYEIQVPLEFSAWIHSDYVELVSTEESADRQATGDSGAGTDSSDPSDESASSSNGPQKGSTSNGAQKGAPSQNQSSDSDSASGGTANSGNESEWVDRLEAIQQRVRKERKREDKLDWDFSSQIRELETYAENVPLNRLKTRAEELRQNLEDLQEKVRKERSSLNERLQKIQEARKAQVRNTIRDVLQAKGFSWDAIGHVRSVGNLYYERPAQFELVKGDRRIYFLQSARDVLKLRNYRGLQVAVSGTEISPEDKQWKVPILRVDKIEPIRNEN